MARIRTAAGMWTAALVAGALCMATAPEASAEFHLVRQCESPTPTVWWSSALYEDDANTLFRQENFPDNGTWTADSELSPGIRDCFGTGTPHSRKVLLHWVLKRPDAVTEQPHPVLLVPGAGDNGKRVFTFMAYALAFEGYNVFSLTFAQPNGDNYQHAEQISNALKVISDLYDGATVDVVAHSMGGIATWIHTANNGSVEWGIHGDARGAAYSNLGTHYAGNVRRLVLLGTPMHGVDTAFRWPNINYTRVLDTPVNAPVSWDTYYSLTTFNLLVSDDFVRYGYFADEDFYPGQAQTLRRMDDEVPLPGSIPALGLMAYQQDWLTTYDGGFGLYSNSRGIDAAVDSGGHVIDKLQGAGVDPAIELYVAYGLNPILPLQYGAMFVDEDTRATYGASMESDWDRLERDWLNDNMPEHAAWGDDVQSVFAGNSVIGELSAPADGIVFAASATHTAPLTLRGAELKELHAFPALNHLELPFAGRLAAYFFDPAEDACAAVNLCDPVASVKYDQPDNQVVEWVDSILHTDVIPPDDPDAGPDAADADPDADLPDADLPDDDAADDDVAPDVVEDDSDNNGANNGDNNGSNNGGADVGDASGPRTPINGTRERSGCAVASGGRSEVWGIVALAMVLGWGRRRR